MTDKANDIKSNFLSELKSIYSANTIMTATVKRSASEKQEKVDDVATTV